MSEFQSEISHLSPSLVWTFFDKICSIPHPSYHEENLAQYIITWAQEQSLDVRRDPTGNIFIKKPATSGMENRKGVVLQAHLDMVPQKNEETVHNFEQDPIRPYIDGEWVTAQGTTLGADNGIGMATCLAVLASDNIQHGPLEVLLTINEEAGMTGAFGLEPGYLEGEILLNTDSEQEGEVYVGCAGGINGLLAFDVERCQVPANHVIRKLQLKGLKGGHSGCDIHLGRGNANKLLARFLAQHAEPLALRLIDFQGGSLRNAIPREGFVTLSLPEDNVSRLTEAFQCFTETIRQELEQAENNIITECHHIELDPAHHQVFDLPTQQRFIATLNASPNGVIRMSDDFPGVVETSLNLGVVKTEASTISILSLVRSLIDSGRQQVESSLRSIAELANAQVDFYDAYPGWKPDTNSAIMAIFREQYENIYGHKPNIMVIHAGLECGLFKRPYPDMDMVSFGPTIKFPHSPDEKVQISTVQQFWEQMIVMLKSIPEKD
ncbi:Cytosol non-specific dipeptidase [Vibrio ruber DSM 16370]|uniref:Cytosol non-specific dipeptidase n=1 Tax=Vibrio ruber (strain DSM 16370 / JCM 11486 / BCRC 17186 / CECT 7878 / LMG 23124 / VR1) TaxID=1123498 RepID=A0A1R4LU58_VIBR1|nr:aminoacyl-histidine dipeptidase [Vibrio ruber]SJN60035.1 Cytosol non-specific dipeptidase [Vibrio ruber DSM 16370]